MNFNTVSRVWQSLATCLLIASVLAVARPASAAEPADWPNMLPESTMLYAISDNISAFEKTWRESPYAKLWNETGLKASREQAESRFNQLMDWVERDYGVTLGELWSACRGRSVSALYESDAGTIAGCVLTEIGEDVDRGKSLIARSVQRLTASGFQKEPPPADLAGAIVYRKPDSQHRVVLILDDGLLGVVGGVDVAQGIMRRRGGASDGGLRETTTHKQLADRVFTQSASDKNVQMFMRPVELSMLLDQEPTEDSRPPFVARHGFNAVKAIGGNMQFGADDCDVTYELAVVAPRPYREAMEIFDFVGGDRFQPPAWIPEDVTAFSMIRWDLMKVINHIGGLVDDAVSDASGTFEGFLEDMRGPLGPGVDLRKEFFPELGPDVMVLTEATLPVSETSERTIVAIATRDPKRVASLLHRLLKDDPDIRALPMRGQSELWQIGEQGQLDDGRRFTSSGIMVTHDALLMSTNVGFIRKLALPRRDSGGLPAASDYQRVMTKLDSVARSPECGRIFARMSRDFRTTYELMRSGKLEQAESLYAALLGPLLGSGDEEATFDPDALPPFDAIAPHLGLTGVSISQVDDGWLINGLIAPE